MSGPALFLLALVWQLAIVVLMAVPHSREQWDNGYTLDLARRFTGHPHVQFAYPDRYLPAAEIVRVAAWLGYRCVSAAPVGDGKTSWVFQRDPALPRSAMQEEWLWRRQRW